MTTATTILGLDENAVDGFERYVRTRLIFDPDLLHWCWKPSGTRKSHPVLAFRKKAAHVRTAVFRLVTGRNPVGNLKMCCGENWCVNPGHATERDFYGKRIPFATIDVTSAAKAFASGKSPRTMLEVELKVARESPKVAHARFWATVDIRRGTQCWGWTGPIENDIPFFRYDDLTDARETIFMIDFGRRPDKVIWCDESPMFCVRPSHLRMERDQKVLNMGSVALVVEKRVLLERKLVEVNSELEVDC